MNRRTLALFMPKETKLWKELSEDHKKQLTERKEGKVFFDNYPSTKLAKTSEREYSIYLNKLRTMMDNKRLWASELGIKAEVPLLIEKPDFIKAKNRSICRKRSVESSDVFASKRLRKE